MQCGLFLTAIWTVLLFQNGVQLSKVLAARQPGYLDFDNLPETNFTCEGKVIGGYYADVETGCQMFHVCTIGQKGDMTDIKFLCLNGTVFDQETRVCERVDEVDCAKSKEFYDLNLELYNNGFIGPEEFGSDYSPSKGEEDLENEEEVYDENYGDAESPESSSKGPSSTTSTTTPSTTTTPMTTTTTTTPRPVVFSSIKPTFNIILPNLKNKSPGGGHLVAGPIQNKNVGVHVGSTIAPQRQTPQQQYSNKNVGTHLTGLLPAKNVQITQTQRPFGFVTTQSYDPEQLRAIDQTALKPPPPSFKPFGPSLLPSSTFKPQVYDPYKNHYFSSSTPSPITSIIISGYNQKPQGLEEIRPSEQSKRPVVVLTHHFPTIAPIKGGYDGGDFTGFSSPSGPGAQYVRQKPRPHVGIKIQTSQQQQQQQQQQSQHQHLHLQQHPNYPNHHHHQHHHQHPHKPNPTILALQSQQKKVHRLHQEGLEMAEHQIAQVANRNAEISSLRSQQREEASSRRDAIEPQISHRETKEIRTGDVQNFGKPAIAIVTSTSSTSSRVQKAPVITVQAVSSARGKPVISRIDYKPETEYKSELEKLFANTEPPKKNEQEHEMDLEQLLLAWKLKTNQEVTKEDIEKVFARLDTSQFENGQTISLRDIFNLKNADTGESEEEEEGGGGGGGNEEEETTRVPPQSYDEYTEEDVPYDPFYKDVPKVTSSVSVRQKRSSKRQGRGRDLRFRATEPSPIDPEIRKEMTTRNPVSSSPSPESIQDEKMENTTKFPETGFTCKNKIPGGFYADTEVDCHLFHVCSDAGNGSLVDHKFFCGEGTKFNQRTRTCQAEELVDCRLSKRYYHLNHNFLVTHREEPRPELEFDIKKINNSWSRK